MTDKELHKLNRKELLELMLDQSRQLDDLREQLRQAQEQLASRQLLLNKAGSIAEASLQLNRVFDAAQAAAEQYLENVQTLSGRQTEVCQQLVDESQQKSRYAAERDADPLPDHGSRDAGQMSGDGSGNTGEMPDSGD